MQCSVLKPEMSLELVVKVKCDAAAADPAEGAQVIAAVVKEALARYLR